MADAFFQEVVVLDEELLVLDRVVARLLLQESQELARKYISDATNKIRVLRLLARNTQGQILTVYYALDKPKERKKKRRREIRRLEKKEKKNNNNIKKNVSADRY